MSNTLDEQRDLGSPRLPDRPIERLIQPAARFLRIETASGFILILAIVVAIILANSPQSGAFSLFWETPIGFAAGSFSVHGTLRSAINEGLMTLFFFVVGLEIKREVAIGELQDPKVAALPISAAVGGMAVPALLYLALQSGMPGERDWGVVMATDIALVVGAMALLGGRVPHSLRIFVLSLAIIDDIGAVAVIVLFYSEHVALTALALSGLGLVIIFTMQRLGVRSIPLFSVAGIATWLAMHESGLHATLVGIVLGLMTPARPWVGPELFAAIVNRTRDWLRSGEPEGAEERRAEVLDVVAQASRESIAPLERIETVLHPWVSFFIVPVFALANAGVPLRVSELRNPIVAAIALGLVAGKPLGILAGSWIAVKLRIGRRPAELSWPMIAAAGALCGIGFTMALFVANLAFGAELLVAASTGILVASAISLVLGLGAFVAASRTPRRRPHP